MKRYSTSLVIREVHIKTTIRYHYIRLTIMAKIIVKKTNNTECWLRVHSNRNYLLLVGLQKCYSHSGKFWQFFLNLSILSIRLLLWTKCWCLPKIHILTPNSQCDGNWRWDLWVVIRSWALMNGISALMKETPDCSLVPSAMWGHSKKMAIYEPGSGIFHQTQNLPAIWTCNTPGLWEIFVI